MWYVTAERSLQDELFEDLERADTLYTFAANMNSSVAYTTWLSFDTLVGSGHIVLFAASFRKHPQTIGVRYPGRARV